MVGVNFEVGRKRIARIAALIAGTVPPRIVAPQRDHLVDWRVGLRSCPIIRSGVQADESIRVSRIKRADVPPVVVQRGIGPELEMGQTVRRRGEEDSKRGSRAEA